MDGINIKNQWQELALINQEGFLEEVLQNTLQKILSVEFEKFIQAKKYERTNERNGYRNGTYDRQLYTRVGTLSLRVCRDREGQFRPSLFEKYQRSEKAMLLGLAEMYIQGVSTRKVSAIVEQLCGHSVSKSLVSNLACSLDEQLEQWRQRPLTKPYPYVVFDARYEKIREGGQVVSKAVVLAIGITSEGIREILGCWVINSESFASWNDCLARLKSRGLQGVEYAVSDDNKGLCKALTKHFQGIKLQRCQVHFMRNFLDKLSKKDHLEGKQLLQSIFAAATKEAALYNVQQLLSFLHSRQKAGVADWLEENIEESLTVLCIPPAHRKKMKSTNMLERFNQELKRRSRVVRIFPNDKSCLRLVTALCQETSEAWAHRKYLDMTS